MTAGTEEPGRPAWVLTPLDSVGPLRFGMSAGEARAALPGARELGRFQAEPHFPEIMGVQFGLQSAAPAVFAYFNPGWPNVWPPPGHQPNWPHGWHPPF